MKKLLVVLILATTACAGRINVDAVPSETTTLSGLSVAVWRPIAPIAPPPLIVFSHGFRGCNTQSTFLMEALSIAGYLVVAPNHADASCGTNLAQLTTSFADPQSWNSTTYQERGLDVSRVLAALESDSTFSWNRNQVGIVGHSLGGYTVLGLGGAWPSWRLPNVKAILALSPYCEPYTLSGELPAIGIPVMYQGGTRDLGITPSVRKAGGCYDKTSSPALYVEFQGAGHLAWTNLQTEQHQLIVRYSVAFLDQYIRGKSATNPTIKVNGVSDLRAK